MSFKTKVISLVIVACIISASCVPAFATSKTHNVGGSDYYEANAYVAIDNVNLWGSARANAGTYNTWNPFGWFEVAKISSTCKLYKKTSSGSTYLGSNTATNYDAINADAAVDFNVTSQSDKFYCQGTFTFEDSNYGNWYTTLVSETVSM